MWFGGSKELTMRRLDPSSSQAALLNLTGTSLEKHHLFSGMFRSQFSNILNNPRPPREVSNDAITPI